MNNIKTKLQGHRFFQSFSDSVINQIASCGSIKKIDANQMLAHEGDPAEEFYAIIDGRIAVETSLPGKNVRVLQTLHAGEIVGWSWIFPPYEWTFDVHVVKDTTLFAFDARCLRGKTENDHELGYILMKQFAQIMTLRLKASRLQLLNLYGSEDQPTNLAPGT